MQLQAQSKIKGRKLTITNHFSVTHQFTSVTCKFKSPQYDTQYNNEINILREKHSKIKMSEVYVQTQGILFPLI